MDVNVTPGTDINWNPIKLNMTKKIVTDTETNLDGKGLSVMNNPRKISIRPTNIREDNSAKIDNDTTGQSDEAACKL